MHCANLDALVKDMRSMHLSSPVAATTMIPADSQESMAETQPDEDVQILKMVLDIGIFVLEGRLPHRITKRGYIEGPHCVLQPPRNQQAHRCDYANYVVRALNISSDLSLEFSGGLATKFEFRGA